MPYPRTVMPDDHLALARHTLPYLEIPDIAILLGVLFAVGLSVLLVQKYWPYGKRQAHIHAAGHIFAGVAVLYAVLLAFVVIVGWQSDTSALQTTFNEADQLANVYFISRSLPLPQGAAIDGLTLKYAHIVIDKEWPLMGEGQSSQEAQALFAQIREHVFGFVPRSGQQQVLYEQAVASVNGLSAARQDRLQEMTDTIPEPLWVTLIAGGVITIGFCLFFGLENKAAHVGMVAGLAVVITMSLLLISDMQFPFANNPFIVEGFAQIGPGALEGFLRGLPAPR